MAERGNVVIPLLLLSGGAAAIWAGFTNPEGGVFAGLASLLRGTPPTKATPDGTAFLPTLSDLAAVAAPAVATRRPAPTPGGGGGGQAAHPGTGTGSGTSSSTDSRRTRVLSLSAAWLGVPYRWGGTTRAGVDCSGLTMQVYKGVGVRLPHYSGAQALMGRPVALADAQPGDLVFFGTPVHHVGIYVGNGLIRNAPHTGASVRDEPIWHTEPVFARDVLSPRRTPTRPTRTAHPATVTA